MIDAVTQGSAIICGIALVLVTRSLLAPFVTQLKTFSVPNNTIPIVNLRSSDIIAYVLALTLNSMSGGKVF